MFERFTERARKVVVLAQEEARHFNHNYIGTEHLLLGLLREEEGVAARALRALDLTVEGARERVASIVGYGSEGPGPQAPFTPRSKKVLELALREAMQLGHNYIGTEHILLGLVREGEGVANQVLSNLGVEPEEVSEEVLRMLGSEPSRSSGVFSRLLGGGRSTRREFQDFRGRMAFEVRARCIDRNRQSPQTILVELDYVYSAQEEEDIFSEAVVHDDLRRGVAGVFEEENFPFVETGIARVEGYIRVEFPAIREMTISVTIRHEPEVTVSRTSRR